jgi:signal transduction histidine kinase
VTTWLLTDAINHSGTPVVAVTRFFPALGWGAIVAMPTEALLEPAVRATRIGMAWTGLIAALALAGSVVAARWLTRPIRGLRDVAVAVQGGDDVRADTDAPGELGELAASFNVMTDTLQRSRADAEARYEDLEVLTQIMAHDLKGPLATMQGFMELLLLERVGSEEQRGTCLSAA